MKQEETVKWTRLLEWTKGFKGFECKVVQRDVAGAGSGLVTTSNVKPDEPLLVVPAACMLNPLTLSKSSMNTMPLHLFPELAHRPSTKKRRISTSQRLNTTQLLTLHLALTRDPKKRHKSEWEIYLDTLPQNFRPWHPLTWLVEADTEVKTKGKQRANGEGATSGPQLLDLVPHEARANLLRVKDRFDSDLTVLRRVLATEEVFEEQKLNTAISIDDILWAWLCVNTRSVSVPLGLGNPTDLFNHSLVPILDFVNHSSYPEECISKPRQIPTPGLNLPKMRSTPKNPTGHLIPGKIAFELRSQRSMADGEELRFEYHSHANTELWAEYGFVEPPKNGKWEEMRWSLVDVQHFVDPLWEKTEMREEKEEVLQAIGCWQNNKLEGSPAPCLSHGLLMTLRLVHLPAKSKDRLQSIKGAKVTYISAENEDLVNQSLSDICNSLVRQEDEARKSLLSLRGVYQDTGMISTLWEEQKAVATGVIDHRLNHVK